MKINTKKTKVMVVSKNGKASEKKKLSREKHFRERVGYKSCRFFSERTLQEQPINEDF